MPSAIILDGESLTGENVVEIARNNFRVEISSRAIERVESGRNSIERVLRSGRTVYGINTGFGKLADTKVGARELGRLQLNLLRSHSVGTGSPLEEDEARAVIAVRLNSLLRGNSGVGFEVVALLKEFLNRRVYPFIPRYGSLGASGDLAPSAHLALCLVGEGFVLDKKGRKESTANFLKRLGMKPLKLRAKEGLAIINGTQVMTGLACLLVHDAESLLSNLDIAGAMCLEALGGSLAPFDPRVQRLRPLHGQMHVAARILKLVRDSTLTGAGSRVQDPYSLRCIPQVHGAFYDSLQYTKSIIESELNSVTDNPLVFPESDEVLNSGNFHGQPVALGLDLLCIALAEASLFSERRIDKLLSGYSARLPLFLTKKAGLNSGLMVAQYTAAALVAENKILAKPASLESASVSAGQEDHASMGVTAALKTRKVLEHTIKVIAIEMLCAAQAIDLQGKVKMGQGTLAAYRTIRKISKLVEEDRSLGDEVDRLAFAIKSGIVERAIERTVQL